MPNQVLRDEETTRKSSGKELLVLFGTIITVCGTIYTSVNTRHTEARKTQVQAAQDAQKVENEYLARLKQDQKQNDKLAKSQLRSYWAVAIRNNCPNDTSLVFKYRSLSGAPYVDGAYQVPAGSTIQNMIFTSLDSFAYSASPNVGTPPDGSNTSDVSLDKVTLYIDDAYYEKGRYTLPGQVVKVAFKSALIPQGTRPGRFVYSLC